jgi:hypothetical protein|tara:strand:+ start:1129 stop:1290 length:162 start_codon:yes stop_codon:yes gene_type:complete
MEFVKNAKKLKMMKCDNCGKKEKLLRARNDMNKYVSICESCYDTLCEGYELIS